MHPALFVLINMAVAGFVGGITNHFAIKMLFHPREEKRIGNWRVPFTPGLIPKRKYEVGASLGKVVAEHLVTTEGLLTLLQKPIFRSRIEGRLSAWVDEWSAKEDTLEELLLKAWPEDRLDEGKMKLFDWLDLQVGQAFERLWRDEGWRHKRLGELLPGWSEEKREELIAKGVRKLVEEIRKELDTLQGERMLRQITSQFMENAGGFLGALAGIFMDGDKVLYKVKAALVMQLESPALQSFAAGFMRDRMIRLEAMTLEDAVAAATGRDGEEWVREQLGKLLDWKGWTGKLLSKRPVDVFGSRKEWLQGKVPWVTERLLGVLASNMSRVVEAIDLPTLVEEEVRKFPIEQVEQIVLSVSGKEFRAITWLGVLLGSFIGLFQSFMLLLR